MSDNENVAEVRPIRGAWDEALARLRQEYDEVLVLEAAEVRIAVRPPKIPEYERFVAQMGDDKKMFAACRGLLKACMLHPAWDDIYAGAFARKPGLITTFGKELLKLAGADAEVEAKKA